MDRPEHGPIVDAREALARHRARTGISAGALYLRQIGEAELEWLRRMTAATARSFNVDADDLFQELAADICDCDLLDRGRSGFRSWMRQRARWRAGDMLRAGRPDRYLPTPPDEVVEAAGQTPAAEHDLGLGEWTAERLRELGLSANEARLVALLCWGLDIPLREVAELIGRGYAATRQDRVRGLRKIKELFDLEPDEEAAFVAVREYRSTDAAAVRLEVAEDEIRRRLRSAEDKIGRILGSGSARKDRHEELPPRTNGKGESDVSR